MENSNNFLISADLPQDVLNGVLAMERYKWVEAEPQELDFTSSVSDDSYDISQLLNPSTPGGFMNISASPQWVSCPQALNGYSTNECRGGMQGVGGGQYQFELGMQDGGDVYNPNNLLSPNGKACDALSVQSGTVTHSSLMRAQQNIGNDRRIVQEDCRYASNAKYQYSDLASQPIRSQFKDGDIFQHLEQLTSFNNNARNSASSIHMPQEVAFKTNYQKNTVSLGLIRGQFQDCAFRQRAAVSPIIAGGPQQSHNISHRVSDNCYRHTLPDNFNGELISSQGDFFGRPLSLELGEVDLDQSFHSQSAYVDCTSKAAGSFSTSTKTHNVGWSHFGAMEQDTFLSSVSSQISPVDLNCILPPVQRYVQEHVARPVGVTMPKLQSTSDYASSPFSNSLQPSLTSETNNLQQYHNSALASQSNRVSQRITNPATNLQSSSVAVLPSSQRQVITCDGNPFAGGLQSFQQKDQFHMNSGSFDTREVIISKQDDRNSMTVNQSMITGLGPRTPYQASSVCSNPTGQCVSSTIVCAESQACLRANDATLKSILRLSGPRHVAPQCAELPASQPSQIYAQKQAQIYAQQQAQIHASQRAQIYASQRPPIIPQKPHRFDTPVKGCLLNNLKSVSSNLIGVAKGPSQSSASNPFTAPNCSRKLENMPIILPKGVIAPMRGSIAVRASTGCIQAASNSVCRPSQVQVVRMLGVRNEKNNEKPNHQSIHPRRLSSVNCFNPVMIQETIRNAGISSSNSTGMVAGIVPGSIAQSTTQPQQTFGVAGTSVNFIRAISKNDFSASSEVRPFENDGKFVTQSVAVINHVNSVPVTTKLSGILTFRTESDANIVDNENARLSSICAQSLLVTNKRKRSLSAPKPMQINSLSNVSNGNRASAPHAVKSDDFIVTQAKKAGEIASVVGCRKSPVSCGRLSEKRIRLNNAVDLDRTALQKDANGYIQENGSAQNTPQFSEKKFQSRILGVAGVMSFMQKLDRYNITMKKEIQESEEMKMGLDIITTKKEIQNNKEGKVVSKPETNCINATLTQNILNVSRKSDCELKMIARQNRLASGFSSSGTPTEVLARKPFNAAAMNLIDRPDHMQNTGPMPDFVIQTAACTDLPAHVRRCCECKHVETETRGSLPLSTAKTNSAANCRFYAFRMLPRDAMLTSTDSRFSKPLEADADEISLWMPLPPTSTDQFMTIETAVYIISCVGAQFCQLAEQELAALTSLPSVTARSVLQREVAWKRAVFEVREMCDACETTVFNVHWTCGLCGFVICPDCYRTLMEQKCARCNGAPCACLKCVRCTAGGQQHNLSELLVTQIIPSDVLRVLQQYVHEVARKWTIYLDCRCDSTQVNFRLPSNNVDNSRASSAVLSESGSVVPMIGDSLSKSNPSELQHSYTSITHVHPDSKLGTLDESRGQIGEKFSSMNFEPMPSRAIKQVLMELPPITERLFRTRELYPGIKHTWLDNGRLLQLLEPDNPENIQLFQAQWRHARPVLVSNCQKNLDNTLWTPESFSREFGHIKNDLIDCGRKCVVSGYKMSEFWDGFECVGKRLRDPKGNEMVLKLKDWPPTEDFCDVLPERYHNLLQALPLPVYTRRDGCLNLVSRLPKYFVRPDLGPKMYNAYGSAMCPRVGSTNLHLDVSDAVNLIMYVGLPEDDSNCEQAALHAMQQAGCCDITKNRVFVNKEKLGALWHIFDPQDADKIRQMLHKVGEENGEQAEKDTDPIHDQSWYLDEGLRERLKREYDVRGYTLVQCVGDAIFIPAGAPHQVRNLHSCIKAAEDFVSPENLSNCFRMMQEFRHLSDTHSNHEDKLQVKNVIYHAVKDAVSVLQLHNVPAGS